MPSTLIEWATDAWSPLEGCTRRGLDCLGCYAERQVRRLQHAMPIFYRDLVDPRPSGTWTGRVFRFYSRLDQPLHWRTPRRIFVCPRSDIFHRNVDPTFLSAMLRVMADTPRHRYLCLTKRPELAATLLPRALSLAGLPAIPDHVWLGLSAGNHPILEERWPAYAALPLPHRWLSLEPLLGQIDLSAIILPWGASPSAAKVAPDWIVTGGESGPGARPCRFSWLSHLAVQCHQARIPLYTKQAGSNPDWSDYSPRPLAHPKGGDPAEWPAPLPRQFPPALRLPGESHPE